MLLSLPVELITKILQYLSVKEILQCSTINKQIYEMITHDTFWKYINKESTHESITNSLSFIRRFKNIKEITFHIPRILKSNFSIDTIDNGNMVIYGSDDLIKYTAYQYDVNSNCISIVDNIYDFTDNKYITKQGKKLYVNDFCTNKTCVIHTRLKNRKVALGKNFVIVYSSKKLSITNLLTHKTINKPLAYIYDIKIFDDNAVIVIKEPNADYILMIYDLLTHTIVHKNVIYNTYKSDRLDIHYYNDKYIDYTIYTPPRIKRTVLFNVSSNKLIYDTTTDFFIFYMGCIINFTKTTISDIENVIGSFNIQPFPEYNNSYICMQKNSLLVFCDYYHYNAIYKWTF